VIERAGNNVRRTAFFDETFADVSGLIWSRASIGNMDRAARLLTLHNHVARNRMPRAWGVWDDEREAVQVEVDGLFRASAGRKPTIRLSPSPSGSRTRRSQAKLRFRRSRSKLRALLQRNEGRDLVDLSHALEVFPDLSAVRVVELPGRYLALSEQTISPQTRAG
jgi:hypothetical protein